MSKGKVVTSNVNYILEKSQCLAHLSNIGTQEEYGTPHKLFNEKCTELNLNLKIDVAASHTNHVLPNYITKEEDLFTIPITQDAFLNPPYGRQIGRWIQKAYESAQAGARVVCLLPSRTDTAWWHDFVMKANEIRFIRGRLYFNDNDGRAPFPSVIVVFGPPKF